ncbi:hypothetical protein UCRNP2_2023 [Neofusicoccum parvum UCRNP2]|uniref:Uncharacterized protein n=1 Tax=Botryosphaeria parva (strain UCR-NP2) TaxID=1287680 RepID=R1GYN4_BOTPV|nr:hypothetical protein UCRNP2_2023 [Neofusicoccum parvum UCRNP2]
MNGPGNGQLGRPSQGLSHNTSCSGALSVNDIYETRQSSTNPNEHTARANPSTPSPQATAQPPPPPSASVHTHPIPPSGHHPSNPHNPGRRIPQRSAAPPTTTPPAWSAANLHSTPRGAYEPASTPVVPATPLAWPEFFFPDPDDLTFAADVEDPDECADWL